VVFCGDGLGCGGLGLSGSCINFCYVSGIWFVRFWLIVFG